MAASALQVAGTLFKSLLGYGDTGKDNGGDLKPWFSEFILAKPLVFGQQIWSDVDKIPITAPTLTNGASEGVVKYIEFAPLEPVDTTLAATLAQKSAASFHLEELKDSIPLNFGDGTYIYNIYFQDPANPGNPVLNNGNPVKLAFGVNDWFVDNASGILQFYDGVPDGISRTNPPLISFYKYIGAKGGGGGGASITISNTAPPDSEPGALWWNSDTGDLLLYYSDGDSTQWVSAIGGVGGLWTLNTGTNTIDTAYTVSASAKNFKIPHPLQSMSDDYDLVHTSVEGPSADLMYRGKVQLTDGKASVNIDESSNMTEGTFVALSHNSQCFINNSVDWTPVRGKLDGNILNIEAKESDCNVEVEWMVLSERRDPTVLSMSMYDENGIYQPEVRKGGVISDKVHVDPIKLEFK
jgi:hypothetical protein